MTKEEARLTLQDNFGYLINEHPRIIEALRVALEVLNEDDFPSNLDEAAEEYANKEHPDEPCVGKWGTGDYEPPVDREYLREIAKDAFKAGAEVIINQSVSLGYLISWYIQSVDGHQPIWTEEHLKELDKDFIIIPKKAKEE